MNAIVRLYSNKVNEISSFLQHFLMENDSDHINLLEWEKKYQNPVEIADIIGTFIDNNDKYSINMWVSIDEGIFINVNDSNADSIIRYLYERFPW